jgi:hypothetical protein
MEVMRVSNQGSAETVWLVLDDAWEFNEPLSFEVPKRVEALESGPSLRYITSQRMIERFCAEFGEIFRPFILFGSGDFHHLTALFIRQMKEPFVILSFDNHPDWVVGPVHWSCGGWVNRALENPWYNRSLCGVAETLNAVFLGAYGVIGQPAAQGACGSHPGDPRKTITRTGSIQFRPRIGGRLLYDT